MQCEGVFYQETLQKRPFLLLGVKNTERKSVFKTLLFLVISILFWKTKNSFLLSFMIWITGTSQNNNNGIRSAPVRQSSCILDISDNVTWSQINCHLIFQSDNEKAIELPRLDTILCKYKTHQIKIFQSDNESY